MDGGSLLETPKMRTIITSAAFHQKSPIVKSAGTWEEFVLLFDLDVDDFRVKQWWDPEEDPADCVLTVRVSSMLSGEIHWAIQCHADSPCHHRNGGFMFHWGTSDKFGAPSSLWEIEDLVHGDVCHFSFSPLWMSNRKRLMFQAKVDEDPAAAGTSALVKPSLTINSPTMKPKLGNFPPELLGKIFVHLPLSTVLHTMPSVSPKMFGVAKCPLNWGRIHLDEIVAIKDIKTLCDIGSGICRSLKLPPTIWHEVDEAYICELLKTIFAMHRWPRLQKLVASSFFDFKDVANLCWIQQGFRKGNFPSVKKLILKPPRHHPEFADIQIDPGSFFDGYRNLKNLTWLCINTRSCLILTTPREFWRKLESLRTLHLEIDVDADIDAEDLTEPPEGNQEPPMPNLEDLAINWLLDEALTEGLCDQYVAWHFGLFQGSLKRLKLEYEQPAYCDRLNGPSPFPKIAAEQLSRSFPGLSVLDLGKELHLDFSPEPGANSLPPLETLRVLTCDLAGIPQTVPFHKLQNLEAARVLIPPEREMKQNREQVIGSVLSLLELPKLKSLALGDKGVERIAMAACRRRQEVTQIQTLSLEMMWGEVDPSDHEDLSLEYILPKFPELKRLRVEVLSFEPILGTIGKMIEDKMAGLQLLELMVYKAPFGEYVGDRHDGDGSSPLDKLLETLPGEWRVDYEHVTEVVLSKKTAADSPQLLGENCFVLDSCFFPECNCDI